jgi:hypothetical protein
MAGSPFDWLVGHEMTLGPNRKKPLHSDAAQRGNPNTARLTTPDSKQPENTRHNGQDQQPNCHTKLAATPQGRQPRN